MVVQRPFVPHRASNAVTGVHDAAGSKINCASGIPFDLPFTVKLTAAKSTMVLLVVDRPAGTGFEARELVDAGVADDQPLVIAGHSIEGRRRFTRLWPGNRSDSQEAFF